MRIYIGQRLDLGFLGRGEVILIDDGTVTLQGYGWELSIDLDTLQQLLVS